MNLEELKDKIRTVVLGKYNTPNQAFDAPPEYEEFVKFPELKSVILDLFTLDYDSFVESIDWVAPKPTMFRINLRNGHSIYLTWNDRSWVATIEGKKYYLMNTPEKQRAYSALSRLLRFSVNMKNEDPAEGEDSGDEDPLDAMADGAEPEETE